MAKIVLNWFHLYKHGLLVTGIYLIIALFITYPLAFQLTTHTAGRGNGDGLEFIWSMWWFKQAIFTLGQSPSHISILNYPEGQTFTLLPLMSQSFLMMMPFWFSPVLAYNLAVISSFVGCGLAGYALCYELTEEKPAAFLGGLLWVVFTNKVGHALAGHLFFISLFALPLFVFALVRWCKKPTASNSFALGFTLLLAVTIHPTYLPYFLLPVTPAVISFYWLTATPPFWSSKRMMLGLASFGTAGVITLFLLLPTLQQTNNGQLSYLVERGAVGFAYDALAFFLPAPQNPFVLKTALAPWSQKIVISEFEAIGYVGWLPLLLAVVGVYTHWPKSKLWLGLGLLGAILALGPLLKVGGVLLEIPVEDGSTKYPILLPYAFLGNLPLFQWSRTPGRVSILLLLALSVLVSYGWQKLTPSLTKMGLTALVGLLIVLESWVIFPFPTFPITIPAPLVNLSQNPDTKGVLTLPWTDYEANLRALYWQTIHHKPLVGGRVYRDLPTGYPRHNFLSHLLLNPEQNDIIPAVSLEQKLAVLTQENIGWVIHDKEVQEGNATYQSLVTQLGLPTAEDEQVAVFTAPTRQLTNKNQLWVLGSGWYEPEEWGGHLSRWFNKQATAYVYTPQTQTGKIQFTAIPGREAHQLLVRLNGEMVGQMMVGDWATYQTPVVELSAGLNIIELVDVTGPRPFVGDLRCLGGSPLWGTVSPPLLCDPTNTTSRELSLALQQLTFVEPTHPLPLTTSSATFGQQISLLGYELPSQLTTNQPIRFSVLWQARQPMPQNYTLFVHFIDQNQQLVTQIDTQPIGGLFPTSQWAAGQLIGENLLLTTPLLPGRYQVQLGWYSWPSLERLSVTNGDTVNQVVHLGELEIISDP